MKEVKQTRRKTLSKYLAVALLLNVAWLASHRNSTSALAQASAKAQTTSAGDQRPATDKAAQDTTALPHPDLPQWPYPPEPPKGSPVPPDDGQLHHLTGSSQAYTMKQVDGVGAVDWFPDTHPKAPTAVVDGKPGSYRSCGNCHLITGYGKPDMQSLNAMPVVYMQQQLEDMKSDLRHASVANLGAFEMTPVAKAVSDTDAKEALEYFHSVGPAKFVRVVEAETVPKTLVKRHSLLVPDPSGAMEPLGNRILELPESYDRTMLRDPTSGFVAYVPPGSLAKGEALVTTGDHGRIMACTACHGADLRGKGETIPPVAGRSPTATGRQLYDFKTGARHGKYSTMMKPAVEKLTDKDIVNISAYLASLPQ